MNQKTDQRRVLILGGDEINEEFGSRLAEYECHSVRSLEEAFHELSNQNYDLFIADTGFLASLDRLAVSEKAIEILNTIGEGVCLVNGEGQITWENAKMGGFDGGVRDHIVSSSLDIHCQFAQKLAESGSPEKLRPRKHSFTSANPQRYYEMLTTPMIDEHGGLRQVATVVFDATAGRKLQQRIDAIDRAGRELMRFDAESLTAMTVEQRIQLIQDKVIKYAKDLLHFDHFIVRLINRKSNELEVLFAVGLPREAESVEIFANSEENGITGYVATTGRSYICNDPEHDPRFLPGLPGVRCSLTVPLRIYDNVIGTLDVESTEERAFREEDRQVAEIFARYIALAMNILDLLVTERFHMAGHQADHLSHELTEPLADIVTAATTLMEEYIGHDEMRRRLQGIVDNVTMIKTIIRDAHKGEKKGILSSPRAQTPARDPLLSGKKVLVVDDESFIRQTISDIIQKFDMFADVAKDGREAITKITQNHYDLVISDIKLPHATGYDVFAAAREQNHDISVILMTGFGYDPHHSIVRANREGLTAVLYKPFKIDQLMAEVRQALTPG